MQDLQLSIGILAHNEASNIGKTLELLFVQDVFQRLPVEVVIVANGCTDHTAAVVKRSLADHEAVWSARGVARVEELVVAGKANAWNAFVHELSSPLASMLVLMDADITLLNSSTISSMVSTLENNPQAVVCVDQPVKDIETKSKRTLFERLLVYATPKINPADVPLCGQLYCALSGPVRQITLPVEITCEDGFLRALLLTQRFTTAENRRRIILDYGASHSFEFVASLSDLFNHEKWIVIGSIVDMLLFERFWLECTPSCNAMTLMSRWNQQDQHWLPRYVESQAKARGWRLLPRSWWTRRWSRFGELPLALRLRRLPVAVLAAALDALIFIAAIRNVRRGRAFRNRSWR